MATNLELVARRQHKQERRLSRPVLQVSSLLLVFYTVMFARWVFIA